MGRHPKIAFVGAGSTVFMKTVVGDILQRPALQDSRIALMDIDPVRLDDAEVVANRLIASLGTNARVSAHLDRCAAIDGADFVVVAFQIGGYRPATVTDFEIPARYGLRQTIADTLGIGGIMRGLRTVPHLWALAEDMRRLCPDALMLQYVNPMAINTWALAERFPDICSVGLCHSVQGTVETIAHDLGVDAASIRYRCAGINHMAFYLKLETVGENGECHDLYPELLAGYAAGTLPKPNPDYPRCPNLVRYEVMRHLGYFVTESSEHFAEYVPWFIKSDRPDLIDAFGIPLDEYRTRCEHQIAEWEEQSKALRNNERIEVEPSHEYASEIINSIWTGAPSVIYGNVANTGLITSLPDGCAVEVPCMVDRNGIQPIRVGTLPPQLAGLMRTNVNVQELVVAALLEERRDHIYHAAMLDPHTAAELDVRQIRSLVDDLLDAHSPLLPTWMTGSGADAGIQR